jgi:hypothetical protein
LLRSARLEQLGERVDIDLVADALDGLDERSPDFFGPCAR